MFNIRRFFYLSSRDLNMQTGSVQEIAKLMEQGEPDEAVMPYEFARAMYEIFLRDNESSNHTGINCPKR